LRPRARADKARNRALADYIALIFGERRGNMKQKPTRRRCCINRTRAAENAKIAAALTKLLDKAQERNHPPAKPIEPPDDKTIASPQMRQGLGKTRAIIADP
jgi:hypothetical protein